MPQKREKAPEEYVIEALVRGLRVLAQFDQDHTNLSLTDLVERTGFNKATVFRILATLEHEGYLERDPVTRNYRPGIKALRLGFAVLSSLDLRQVARPHLENLASSLDLTASLSVLDGMDVVYVDRVRNRSIMGVVLELGSRIPAHCSSMGKAMLAHLPPDELEDHLASADLTACTSNSIKTLAEFRETLEIVRAKGVAFNIEELAVGLRAVAAPIFDQNGRVVAAINVSGTSDAISVDYLQKELASKVKAVAQRVSQSLL